jgi:hypothetical protein
MGFKIGDLVRVKTCYELLNEGYYFETVDGTTMLFFPLCSEQRHRVAFYEDEMDVFGEEITISEINTLKNPLLYANGLTPNGKFIEFVPLAALERI